ncbi:rhodanese-like domain-containing protein [Saccharicrinis aurantiacus]|uniref:rhodanese-like domain-containing protein n=1 Tax=Saccharicrinis aurantiacus TaxID=1849719 RepID=UPI002491581C|nr:rhodanese-like domain-containing protein [Saccharicrinis aurantiacus]
MGFLSKLFGNKNQAIIDSLLSGAKIIDVRTPQEFKQGNIDASINIPLDKLKTSIGKLKKMNTAYVVCCASGIRSAQAASILKSNGITEVINGGSWHKIDRLV